MEGDAAVIIAIDGPSGSGKSTLSKSLARTLELEYLDTGATYRAATIWCRTRGIDLDNQPAVAAAVREMELEMGTDPDNPRCLLAGQDVTDQLHAKDISEVVSKVAVNLEVRAELKRRQRAVIDAATEGIVAEGRDVTTVVAPDADVRILLIASEDARLARRAMERYGAADAGTLAATRSEVVDRDQQDATVSEFMQATDGVYPLDNSAMTPEQSLAAALQIVEAARGAR